MDKIRSGATVDFSVLLKIDETEARALLSLTSYGAKPFLEWFYKNLGKSYMQQHEKGLISLFETIKKELPQHLSRADDARRVFESPKEFKAVRVYPKANPS